MRFNWLMQILFHLLSAIAAKRYGHDKNISSNVALIFDHSYFDKW